MTLDFQRYPLDNGYINIHRKDRLLLGFSEQGLSLSGISSFLLPNPTLSLKQTHSAIIHYASKLTPGTQGDGIILDKPGIAAVIKTADCTPLFFWDKNYAMGGVIHVGWQGLHKGIEQTLLGLIENEHIPLGDLSFYMGPSIEKNCYEVGKDLYEKFSAKAYREDIFFPRGGDKYLMDVKKGIALSLTASGIQPDQIGQSTLCTRCEATRLPSYRREPQNPARIYNFLKLG